MLFSIHVYPGVLSSSCLKKIQEKSVVHLSDLNSLHKFSMNFLLVFTYRQAYLYKAHVTWLGWKLLF